MTRVSCTRPGQLSHFLRTNAITQSSVRTLLIAESHLIFTFTGQRALFQRSVAKHFDLLPIVTCRPVNR